jgi:transposase InsO family protein
LFSDVARSGLIYRTIDRIRLVCLANLSPNWKQALHIVQPDTLLRWHRDLFRFVWRRKSKPKGRRRRISQETIGLIRQMASANLTWGAERIRGELLKLCINISKRSIQKYIDRDHNPSSTSQTWPTFLKNHAPHIWACDFVQVYDFFFRSLFVFVVIEHSSRRIVHSATTAHPTDAWVAQQLKEATPWGEGPRFLIRDNDGKFGQQFSAIAASTGIEEILTPVRAPNANSICERFCGSLRRECLDHMLVLNGANARFANRSISMSSPETTSSITTSVDRIKDWPREFRFLRMIRRLPARSSHFQYLAVCIMIIGVLPD